MPMMTLDCERCGRTFRARQRDDKPRRYCSRECRDAAQTTRVRLVCRQCGRAFERKSYQREWSRERGPFCSLACYGAWQRGRQGPRPRPSGRESMMWEENRHRALERDGHRCVRCGSANLLHVHHRHHWSGDDPATHALDNLETLCAGCHRRAHPLEHGPDGRFLPRDRLLGGFLHLAQAFADVVPAERAAPRHPPAPCRRRHPMLAGRRTLLVSGRHATTARAAAHVAEPVAARLLAEGGEHAAPARTVALLGARIRELVGHADSTFS